MARVISPGYALPGRDLRAYEDLPLKIPPGSGLRIVPSAEWKDLESLFGYLMVWEPPRRDQLYVLSADVASGTGKDRSVADVTRVATQDEPDEQVAQWVSPYVDPVAFAGVLDVMGRFYKGSDGMPAVCAIEVLNFGIATQSELQNQYGYDNLYVWEKEDARDPQKRQTNSLGWETNRRTRPLMLARYLRRVRAQQPGPDGKPDLQGKFDLYRVNSPFTLAEMKTFKVPVGYEDFEAQADPLDSTAHDDCIIAGAIGVFIAQKLYFETGEPLDAKRRRLAEEKRRQEAKEHAYTTEIAFHNQDYTLEEMEDAWADKSRGLLGPGGRLLIGQDPQ